MAKFAKKPSLKHSIPGRGMTKQKWSFILLGLLAGVSISMLVWMVLQLQRTKDPINITIKRTGLNNASILESETKASTMNSSYSKLPSDPKVYPNELPKDQSTLAVGVESGTPGLGLGVESVSTHKSITTINIPTRGVPPSYQQVGLLVSERNDGTDDPIILPLFGRPTYVGSSKFEYYAATDKANMMRIPISINDNNCSKESGCNEIYNDDQVYVSAYQKTFKVSMYEKDTPRYIPV